MAEFFQPGQNWQCPSCKKNIILANSDLNDKEERNRVLTASNDSNGFFVSREQIIGCRLCGFFVATVGLYRPQLSPQKGPQLGGDGKAIRIQTYREVQLYPLGLPWEFPAGSVPDFIVQDLSEASAIVDSSPRAAMVLARRCLQDLIRNYYKIIKKTLHEELLAIKGKPASEAWDALMAIKGLGNDGAHPADDPALSPEISASEAAHAIDIMRYVIELTYVEQHRRTEALQKMVAIHSAKHP